MIDQRFKKYLEDNYYEKIYDAIKRRLNSTEDLESFEITNISISDKFNLEFACEMRVDAYINNQNYSNVNQKAIVYKVSFEGTFDNNYINCSRFVAKRDDEIWKKQEFYLDSTFVPHIEDYKYEEIAQIFLEKYYPEYKSGQAINIPILLKRLNLKLEYRKLSLNNNIFGIVCINDSSIESFNNKEKVEEKVSKGTIFVDREAHYYFASGKYSANFTIIHECIHWFLHRKYFLFDKMLNKGINAIACNVNGIIENFDRRPEMKWIEKQANRIALKILLPKGNVQRKYLEFFRNCEGSYNYEKTTYAVKSLSDYFAVSIMVVKNRLFELGNNEIGGIYEYIDGHYINSYYFKNEGKENISYSIGNIDSLILFIQNKEFREKLLEGRYSYIDNHLCINDKKFIEKEQNISRLTPYARDNISKCCIPFNYSYESHSDTFELKDYAFCRKNMINERIDVKISINRQHDFPKKTDEEMIKESFAEITKELNSLTNSFTESLKKLMDNRDITIEELAFNSGIDEKTIRRIRTGETKNPDIKTLIAICIGLKLHPDISLYLIKKSNYNIDANTEINHAYKFVLSTMFNKSIEEVNAFLESVNMERL